MWLIDNVWIRPHSAVFVQATCFTYMELYKIKLEQTAELSSGCTRTASSEVVKRPLLHVKVSVTSAAVLFFWWNVSLSFKVHSKQHSLADLKEENLHVPLKDNYNIASDRRQSLFSCLPC